MDLCTIVEFRDALQHCQTRFATLKGLRPDISTLGHTRHFAECQVYINGQRAIIYAPTTPQAMVYARQAERAIGGATKSHALTPYNILDGEIILSDNRSCSLIVEYPCQGIALCEAVYTLLRPKLINGLNMFREDLAKNSLSHNNLRSDNIIVADDGTWHCIRQYYTSTTEIGDKAAFEKIEALIERYTLGDEANIALNDVHANYSTRSFVGGRRRVSEDNLVGFEDNNGRRVIECKYAWASDFVEGRAVVKTTDGHWGLIDSLGNEIIEPIYDKLDYDAIDGQSSAYHNGKCYELDYNGELLNENEQ